jgi:hypothetical protein
LRYAAREAITTELLCLSATPRNMPEKNKGKLLLAAYHVANRPDGMTAQVAKTAFNSCLHQALRLQKQRVMLASRGSQQHWVMSKPNSLLSSFLSPCKNH